MPRAWDERLLLERIDLTHWRMSDWYYAENNEQKGPVNESELKTFLATNRLPADALVWQDGMANWTPANQVAAFSFRPPPMPAQPQPGVAVASATSTPNPSSVTPVTTSDIIGLPEALEVDPDDAEKNKIFGILAYLGILCLVPIFATKDSPYAKYHANQGLTLFLAEIVIWIGVMVINGILIFILPSSLGFISFLFSLIYLGPLILIVLGIINAAQGKCVPLPIIGGIRLLK
jgi:uncharacterized membrane protein